MTPYYASVEDMEYYFEKNNDYVFYGDNGEFLRVVNEEFNLAVSMRPKIWHLLPNAYSIRITPSEEV